METGHTTSLAQVSCEELFFSEYVFVREYEQWLDEREQEWERTMAYADTVGA